MQSTSSGSTYILLKCKYSANVQYFVSRKRTYVYWFAIRIIFQPSFPSPLPLSLSLSLVFSRSLPPLAFYILPAIQPPPDVSCLNNLIR